LNNKTKTKKQGAKLSPNCDHKIIAVRGKVEAW